MFGFIESSDKNKYPEYSQSNISIPSEYKIKDIGPIWNQGNIGCCVSCSLMEMYNFIQLSHGKKLDLPFDYIYNKRNDQTVDGMMPSEGFNILKKEGRINVFSRISNVDSLKESILSNGPAGIGMIVKDSSRNDFWNGDNIIGAHMVSVIGYTKDSLIIKNSWGVSYGDRGIWYLPMDKFNSVVKEAWTILL